MMPRRTKKRPARTGRFQQHRDDSTPRARREWQYTTVNALTATLYGGKVTRDDRT